MGTATASWQRYDVGAGANPGAPVVVGQSHPTWSFLECDKVTIRREEGGWACEAQFYGVTGTPDPVYDLDYSTSEEPIETHVDFRRTIGGTPQVRLNGATFDADGAFNGFTNFAPADTTTADTWRGIRAYLNPGAVWRKNYVTKTRPTDLGQVGAVDIPEGSPPLIPNGRNWLYIGLTWEQRGLTYQVRKEWRASGRRGWNTTIYA